jgi:hypothetical protein
MTRRIQRQGPTYHRSCWHVLEQIFTGFFIGQGVRAQHQRLPAQQGQMLHKPQGTLYATATGQRGKVVGNHQNFFHQGSSLLRFRTPITDDKEKTLPKSMHRQIYLDKHSMPMKQQNSQDALTISANSTT